MIAAIYHNLFPFLRYALEWVQRESELKLEFAAETAQKTHESRWNHEKDWKNKEMEMKREAEVEIQKRESQYSKFQNK